MDFLSDNTVRAETDGTASIPECITPSPFQTNDPQSTYSLEDQVNIYLLDMILTSENDCTQEGIDYTGFATVIDSDPANPNTDDELIMVITNGVFSVFGVINK